MITAQVLKTEKRCWELVIRRLLLFALSLIRLVIVESPLSFLEGSIKSQFVLGKDQKGSSSGLILKNQESSNEMRDSLEESEDELEALIADLAYVDQL